MACHITRERVLDVAENLEEVSCTERTFQGNDFELVSAVTMELDIP